MVKLWNLGKLWKVTYCRNFHKKLFSRTWNNEFACSIFRNGFLIPITTDQYSRSLYIYCNNYDFISRQKCNTKILLYIWTECLSATRKTTEENILILSKTKNLPKIFPIMINLIKGKNSRREKRLFDKIFKEKIKKKRRTMKSQSLP